jgi:hypothetical protein
MKTIFSLIFSLTLTMSAFAGNEGPQAVPRERGNLVAESIVNIAFAPPSVPSSIRYQIYSTGYTQVITYMRDNKVIVKALKPFNVDEAAAIVSLVNEIDSGELYDPNPSAPGCYDAPFERKVVYSSKGEIQITSRANCKNSERENANQADAELIKVLNNLIYSVGL